MATLYLKDLTANHNDLTNFNTATASSNLPFATNNVNSVSLVAASSQYLSAADSTSLSVTNNFTLECWVYLSAVVPLNSAYTVQSKFETVGNQRSFIFHLSDNATVKNMKLFTSLDGTAGGFGVTLVGWAPSATTWYHIAVTFASGTVKYYVNGSQQGTDQTDTNTSTFDGTSAFLIGANVPSGPMDFFDGLIDDVRVYNVVRSQAQIAADYQQELIGNETNLQAYWPFESPSATGNFFLLM